MQKHLLNLQKKKNNEIENIYSFGDRRINAKAVFFLIMW